MNYFIPEKTQEISFALLRVAAYVRRFELRKKIETLAYHLVENIYYQNFELAITTLDAISGFLALGKNVYEVEPINAKILHEQISILTEALKKQAGLESIDHLEKFFSAKPIQNKPTNHKLAPLKLTEERPIIVKENNPAIRQSISQEVEPVLPDSDQQDNPATESGILDGIIRQTTIIDKIRQSADKRLQLKDLISIFPEVSERTLRYDLKRLCDQGRLVRQGNGGPSNFYALNSA